MAGCAVHTGGETKTPARPIVSRVERRLQALNEGDNYFFVGDYKEAGQVYSQGAADKEQIISQLAKRKLATISEVKGDEKGALKLLKEVTAENGSKFASDPLTTLKRLYFAERVGDQAEFEKCSLVAEQIQAKIYSVLKDELIAPGSKRNTFYALANEAAPAKDWTLYNWAIDHANKISPLSDQQWLQVAMTLEFPDPKRSAEICKKLSPKLSGEDQKHVIDLQQRANERASVLEVQSRGTKKPTTNLVANIEKYESTGYWTTGLRPQAANRPMRLRQSR